MPLFANHGQLGATTVSVPGLEPVPAARCARDRTRRGDQPTLTTGKAPRQPKERPLLRPLRHFLKPVDPIFLLVSGRLTLRPQPLALRGGEASGDTAKSLVGIRETNAVSRCRQN